jgi:hypothetical protein
MKFADSRITQIKVPNQKVVHHEATPRTLSPYENGVQGGQVRSGVKKADVMQPTHNRASRRGTGQKKPRKRLAVEPHWLQNLKQYRKLQAMHEEAQNDNG